MIALACIILAAICKAVADQVDHHFGESVFKNLNPEFWDRDISQDKAKRIFGYKLDAWHLFLSVMIVLMILAIVLHENKLPWYWELLIGGAVWNLIFNLFYNKLLR